MAERLSDAVTGSPDDPWMTVAEFAEAMRMRPVTVRSWITKGQLKATRAGQRKWLVRRTLKATGDRRRDLPRTLCTRRDFVHRVTSGSRTEGGGSA